MTQSILIVDDEPNVRLSYRRALETEGYTTVEAQSGDTALELLAGQPFALVLLDLQMPAMNGLELLATMRERGFQTPVAIITAHGDVPHAVRAMKLGAIDFLAKPLTPATLRRVVMDVFSRHHRATPIQPPSDDFDSHVIAAKRLLNLQDFTQAQKHLVRALELNNQSAEGFNLAGVLFEMQEDYERARKYYGQAIKHDQHYAPAQQNMRRLFELFNFGSSQEPISLGDD